MAMIFLMEEAYCRTSNILQEWLEGHDKDLKRLTSQTTTPYNFQDLKTSTVKVRCLILQKKFRGVVDFIDGVIVIWAELGGFLLGKLS